MTNFLTNADYDTPQHTFCVKLVSNLKELVNGMVNTN